MWLVYVGMAVFAVVLFFPLARSWFRKTKPSKAKPADVSVIVTDQGFTVTDSQQNTAVVVDWAKVTRVTAITTDQGPWLDDLFYHVVYAGGELTVPSEAASAFIAYLASLPGFNADALAVATKSRQNNSFVVIYKGTPPLGGGA